MSKRVVIAFYSIFSFFVLAIALIHSSYFDYGITGKVVEEGISLKGDFDFYITSYSLKEGVLNVNYYLKENTGKDQHLSLEYRILNGKIMEGSDELFLAKNFAGRFVFSLEGINMNQDLDGSIVISNGLIKKEDSFSAPVNRAITGNAVQVLDYESKRNLFFFAVLSLVIGAFVFLNRSYERKIRSLSRLHKKRFIVLEHHR